MKPFIYHAASNEIVEKATIKEPECELSELDANAHPEFAERLIYEWNVYDQHIASLLRRTCHPSCKEVWKDGEEVVEGKDYIIEKLPCEGCSKGYSCYNWQIGDCRDSNNKGTCIPLTQQDSEEELLQRFIKPTDDQMIGIALLFNDGRLDAEELSNMVGMCQLVVDRLYENGDILIPSSKENK